MADNDVDPVALEEERLMRAVSKKGFGSKPVVMKKSEPTPVSPRTEKKDTTPGAIPKWKQAQMDREAEEKKRQDEERKKKEEEAARIKARVAEFGSNVDQEDETIEKFLASPRGDAEKPQVEKTAFVDPLEAKQKEKEPEDDKDESYVRPPCPLPLPSLPIFL